MLLMLLLLLMKFLFCWGCCFCYCSHVIVVVIGVFVFVVVDVGVIVVLMLLLMFFLLLLLLLVAFLHKVVNLEYYGKFFRQCYKQTHKQEIYFDTNKQISRDTYLCVLSINVQNSWFSISDLTYKFCLCLDV